MLYLKEREVIMYTFKNLFILVFSIVAFNLEGVTVTGTGAATEIFPPPPSSIEVGMYLNPDLRYFFEGRISAIDAPVDVRVGGISTPGDYTIDVLGDRIPGMITGTYDSWYLHYDVAGSQQSSISDITFTFDQAIAGIIFSDQRSLSGGTNYLALTRPTFGLPGGVTGLTYAGVNNGLELRSGPNRGDTITVSGDRKALTVNVLRLTTLMDEIRILVHVPEPKTYVIMGSLVIFLLLIQKTKNRKRKKQLSLR